MNTFGFGTASDPPDHDSKMACSDGVVAGCGDGEAETQVEENALTSSFCRAPGATR